MAKFKTPDNGRNLNFKGIKFKRRLQPNLSKILQENYDKISKIWVNFLGIKDKSVCPKCGGELQDYAEIEKWNQIEKNKKLERYYKFEKEWLKTIKKQGSEK